MSAVPVTHTRLSCDTCGALWPGMAKGVTMARIAAASDGWKFTEWDVAGLNTYAPRDDGRALSLAERRKLQKVVPRQWDSCLDCPLPDGPEEAHKIRKAREATQ